MIIILFLLCIKSVLLFNFNMDNVKEISVNSAYGSDTYFGYSVLLQDGTQPLIIIGAPKLSSRTGGGVFACKLNGICTNYDLVTSNGHTFTGNFLGMSMDGTGETGGPFIVCAPKKVKAEGENNLLPGHCFYKQNSSYVSPAASTVNPLYDKPTISVHNKVGYYDYGFGEAGLDVRFIDRTTVLLGAPGVKNWNGAIVVDSLSNTRTPKIIPERKAFFPEENDTYFGYTVGTATITVMGEQVAVIVGGSPRGGSLNGAVKMYDFDGNLVREFFGEEPGSYFGSSVLAVDMNNDQIDDLLVGAPMGSGSTYDEGYVYVYLSITRSYQAKLTGSRKTGARFGTLISTLGDIDLDGYQDIAISAPFEDDGIGAVYIYRGGSKGIEIVYSQRLSPSSFQGNSGNVRGFGLGISKGKDIDGNGHNDLVVGAFKSGQVFVIKTRSIIDFQLSLDTNVSSIGNGPIAIKYCIYYTQKGKVKDVRLVNFKVKLNMDYRVNGENNFEHTWVVPLERGACENLTVTIQPSMIDIQPFRITLSADVTQTEAIALGQNKIEKLIPFSHGCGDDNVCQTDISLEASSDKKLLVLGLDNTLNLDIFADNHGEPGYQCLLYLNIPVELDYRNKDKCKKNESLICPFASSLPSTANMHLKFDITHLTTDKDSILVQFEIKCLGRNLTPNKQAFVWNVVTKNSPYIEGKSEPNNLYYGNEDTSDQEITHTFTVGNFGPSPAKLVVTFLLPIVDKEANLFKVLSVKGLLNGHSISCSQKYRNNERGHRPENFLVEYVNKSVILDCSDNDSACVEISCDGGYLYRSSETATFDIKINADLKSLGSRYKSEQFKDSIIYVSSAFLNNSTTRIENYASTLIFSASKNSVPLWIYIVGALIGCLLLLLVIFLLYKVGRPNCNF
ncbi:unnamed protein product [Acanthoscelides obtectus]|uniref:Uncharacterized protein n=1 Tax=Acanthoscelides obtectus TaxID=200917 RepID=A0A9P0KEU5_ACAOB|nr:unnamed protein product [Acanthoscelides obtectus]CAK1657563.1 Integrin alpha-PS3 [Acanthoscelides obtectus]